jgi:uncharacterized repeat protein (TIGR03803 family)
MRGKKFSIGLKALAIFAVTLLVTGTWAATNWKEKALHNFGKGTDGWWPEAGLIFDAAGNLYGVTALGGPNGLGTVFELTPTAGGGWKENVLFGFNGTDGWAPSGSLIFDAAGNLYGTTEWGGIYYDGNVFELTPIGGGNWAETQLYSFNPNTGTDGASPYAGVIFDATGNLYGTTEYGGIYGHGTVFELTPNGSGGWTEQVLHNFDGTDGSEPAGLIFDATGNLYSTTGGGGAYGAGTVFELTPNGSGGWTETVLYSFCSQPDCTDGLSPEAGLIFDAAGNLYGTTYSGGTYDAGTVFELTPTGGGAWTERVLHGFGKGTDGAGPSYYGKLIFDAAGNLYGMTLSGGAYGFGTAFELTPTAGGGWTEQVLYSFNNNGADGISPFAGLTFDAAGNLYGTTWEGGIYSCGGAGSACGTVFELSPVYSCAKCSHTADRELNVFPAERRDVLEQGGIERQ